MNQDERVLAEMEKEFGSNWRSRLILRKFAFFTSAHCGKSMPSCEMKRAGERRRETGHRRKCAAFLNHSSATRVQFIPAPLWKWFAFHAPTMKVSWRTVLILGTAIITMIVLAIIATSASSQRPRSQPSCSAVTLLCYPSNGAPAQPSKSSISRGAP